MRGRWMLQGRAFRTRGWPCLLVVLGACAPGPDRDPADALPPGAPLALSETPELVVGERNSDPAHRFHRVERPFLLPGGGVGVPLAGDDAIRLFDAAGDLVGSRGSTGRGPGELAGLSSAWSRGDTVEAFDRSGRITRFAPDEPPRTVRLEAVASAQSAAGPLGDGSWVLYGVEAVRPNGRDRVAVHRFARDGRHVKELHRTGGFRRHTFPGGSGPDPLSPRPIVRTAGELVLLAETLTPRITELDPATGESRTIEWVPRSALATGEATRLVREGVAESGLSEAEKALAVAALDALRGNEEVPVFQDFLVDPEGFLWVRDYEPRIHAPFFGGLWGAGPGGEWSVLDRTGRRVTTITVPDDFEPARVYEDRLIGIRRNPLDVESVRVYGIERVGDGGTPAGSRPPGPEGTDAR